ncbi:MULTISPECIES: GntP family permease [Croceitalea]|uniref:GntP family permease n=1 Tax=Croceitalea vernalis TaxID=3075599 RepID=A0ABU3BFG8_9FLAO|nr:MULTISPECIES: GntP family permease [unclassified Croceitalea]MDT0539094.1 GntP family permease [Croceitalea sp. P059]MDT0620888.1 GntP family permease [Croceitalea sp. P007]
MIIFLLLVSVAFIILFTVKWKIHPFLALLVAALFYALAANMPFEMILTSIEEGFGGTLGKIGLVILLGVIIGAFLENSGGAYKMAEVVLKIIGRKRIHAAMAIIGYIVSIPVFSDSGFIILNPLNKSLSKKAGLSIAGTSVALALGLLLTHVMVPPTPGPIAAAAILEADIGLVMLIGISVSALSLIIAIIYSKRIAGKTYIDPNPELSEEQITAKMIEAPSAFKSFLPILIPILLIVGKSLSTFLLDDTYADTSWFKFIGFIGSPIIALIIGVLLSFLLPKKFDVQLLSDSGWVGKALLSASSIILITGAGGIFGKILQNSGIGDHLAEMLSGVSLGIWLPFILTAAIKTAQGSSTVALITAASIMAPLMVSMGFDTEIQRAMVVIAIGAGALVVPHANDSGFWVVTQLTGMDIKTGYKLYTLGALITGLFAALMVFLITLFV